MSGSAEVRPASPRDWRALVAAALAGLLAWLALPAMVITLDDDFGYLRSVVQTVQHGQPWTDEWLAPWAGSSSALAAMLFAITDDFPFAIHFSLALAVALAFGGLSRHLRDQGFSFFTAALLSLAVIFFPSVLNMHLMYTAVPLYWGCMWCCLGCAFRRHWGWFFVFWFIAFSSRQSAITWLALPAWPLLEHVWRRRTIKGLPGAELRVLAGAVAAFLCIKLVMNPTVGRAMAGGGHRTMLSWTPMLKAAGLALLAFGNGFGGRNVARALTGGAIERARPAWMISLGAVAGAVYASWIVPGTIATHNCLGDTFAPAIFALLGALGGAGIVLSAGPPRWDACVVALGASALLLLYRADFDYYFVDLFAWGLFSAARSETGAAPQNAAAKPLAWIRPLAGAALACVLLWDVRCYCRLKLAQDITAGVITAYEQALRGKKLAPQDIGTASFGYAGWHYARHFLATDGRGTTALAGFVNYLLQWDGTDGNGVVRMLPAELKKLAEWLPAQNNASLRASESATTLVTVRSKVLWFFRAKFELKHLPPKTPRPGRLALDAASFQQDIFPLNREEWSGYIRGTLTFPGSSSAGASPPP